MMLCVILYMLCLLSCCAFESTVHKSPINEQNCKFKSTTELSFTTSKSNNHIPLNQWAYNELALHIHSKEYPMNLIKLHTAATLNPIPTKTYKREHGHSFRKMLAKDDRVSPGKQNYDENKTLRVTKKDYICAIGVPITISYLSLMLMLRSCPGSWRFCLAGGICASISHTMTTPIDVVKTRQQVDPNLKDKGFVKATLYVVKSEGIQALLSGLGPTTIGYLYEGAAKFGMYEMLKPTIKKMLTNMSLLLSIPFLDSYFLNFLICGFFSGLLAAVIVNPMEALRIRMVAESEFAKLGFVDGGIMLFKQEGGVKVAYKGFPAMISKMVPYTITKQATFDSMIKIANVHISRIWGLGQLNAHLKFLIKLISAVISAGLSAVSSQPGDTLLSLANAQEGTKSTNDFAKELMRKEGVRGFFKGMKTRFLHVVITVTAQLLLYDFFKQLCRTPVVLLD